MQIANFYPTDTTTTAGIECTAWIPDLFAQGILQSDIGKAYAMGYIPYDESPQSLFDLHTITIGNNLTAINFGTFKENRAWGYCWHNSTSSTARFGGQAYGIEAGNSLFTLLSNADRKIRFTNSIQYSQLFMVDTINIRAVTFCFATANIDENENAHNGSTYKGYMTTDYVIRRQDIHDFLNGTYSITDVRYKHPDSDDTYTTTLSYSDFDVEKGIAKKVVDSDYTVYIIFNNVGSSLNGARYSYYNGSYWTNTTVNLTPFILCSVDNTVGFPEQKILYTPLGFSSVGAQPRFTLINSKENFAPSPEYGTTYHCIKYACASWYGSLDTVNLSDFSKTSGIHYEMIRGRCFLYFSSGNGNTFEFIPIVKPVDIYRAYLLFNSVNTGVGSQASLTNPDPPNYSSIQTVALFKEDNTPKYEYEQGDTAQAATPAILQPWQMPNAYNYDNAFDTDDIPEYNPEPGSGEDWDGDRILPPVISGIGDLNGFITMYGMKPSQVAALGNYLWAKFTDATFWESISAVLDNTASIDPSVILNYVVSIRAYPFDLSDVAGTTNEFPLVYFGRGLIGIPVEASPTSLSLRMLHKCVDTFAGGDLSVPVKYGDFRDMEPCAKLLLHVPFCGSCEINPSQVVGKHLFLRYTIDFATGGMMAICYTSDNEGNMAYPVAELHGHVGASVQLTGSNELDALQSLAGVGSGIASLMMGNPAGLLSGVVGAASSLVSNRAVPHSTGKASGFSAYFQPRVPYIEIVYDQYYKPSNYAHVHGNACQVVAKIGSLHGYTVCKNVDTSGLTCEGDERIVIKRIMESGFYVD